MFGRTQLAWIVAGCCAVSAVSLAACGSQTPDVNSDANEAIGPRPEPPKPNPPEPKPPIPTPGPTDTGDPPPAPAP